VAKGESKIQIFRVNDKVYFDVINREEFLARTTRKAEARVLNSAQHHCQKLVELCLFKIDIKH